MQLKISKHSSIYFLLGVSLFGGEILSDAQNKSLNLQIEKGLKESEAKRYEWLKPINYTGTYQDEESKGKDFYSKQYNLNSKISITQPIFKSGGISSTMKYADNIKYSSNISVEIQKKELVKNAINIAFTLKRTDLLLEQAILNLNNANIDLKIKRESVSNGLLDVSFLNNAILNKNAIESKILELKFTKSNLLISFANLSTKNPYEIELPTLSKVEIRDFNDNNLEIKKIKNDIDAKKNIIGITASNYLPSASINGSYGIDHKNENQKNQIVGATITIPFDVNYFASTSVAKTDYLKSTQDLEILKTKETNFFKSQEVKLEMIDSKIFLAKENIDLYNLLLKQNIELENVGLKTKYDVEVLKNSRDSELLNLSIFNIDKQIELLEIYGKMENGTI